MPFHLIQPVILSSIVYFGMGFEADVAKFFRFIAFLMMLVMSGQAFGLFIGSLFKRFAIANTMVP